MLEIHEKLDQVDDRNLVLEVHSGMHSIQGSHHDLQVYVEKGACVFRCVAT